MKYEFKKVLQPLEVDTLLSDLKKRIIHKDLVEVWKEIAPRLATSADLWKLNAMAITGGEPILVRYDAATKQCEFWDGVVESPKERRSLCYDKSAWDARKDAKPASSAEEMATAMGATLLDTEAYKTLQTWGDYDLKTSSWLETPASIRALGGAIFGDKRYGTTFIYHNGASSYYAARGFRVKVIIDL